MASLFTIQDGMATLGTLMGSIFWLRLWDKIAARGWIQPTLSRKIIHITTGPLFVLCWPFFSESFFARVGAALAPLIITLQFIAVGLEWIQDPDAVKAMTRTGNPREILKGPLIYGLIFVGCTLVFWRSSSVGILALMIVCGGDGLADIVGRRFGWVKLPWNPNKSWIGSFAMFAGALSLSIGILLVLGWVQVLPSLTTFEQWSRVMLIVAIATVVESLPIQDFDNLTISGTSILLGVLLL